MGVQIVNIESVTIVHCSLLVVNCSLFQMLQHHFLIDPGENAELLVGNKLALRFLEPFLDLPVQFPRTGARTPRNCFNVFDIDHRPLAVSR